MSLDHVGDVFLATGKVLRVVRHDTLSAVAGESILLSIGHCVCV